MELLIHAANVIYLVAYWVKDVYWLRMFTVLGSLLLIPYFLFRSEPLWSVIAWNVAFLGINFYQLIKCRLKGSCG